jgi:cytoskeletal protein CcmA (bactofilin family)
MFSEKVTSAIKGGNTSVLSVDLNIVGNIKSDGVLEVEGKIEGDINGNTVTLRESSVVHGTVIAKTVNVKGKFNGSIKSEKVSISGKAEIVGNIDYVTLSVEDGSSIFGELKRVDNLKAIIQDSKNSSVGTTRVVSSLKNDLSNDRKDDIKKDDIKK